VTPFLELKITPLETPWWVLYGGVDVPAGFRVVEEVKEIGEWLMIRLDDYEIAAIGVKEVIAQAETTNHAPNLPSNPTPANLATGISLAPTLSWIGGDPDGDAVEYDVYFEAGDSSPDVLVSEDQAGTTYTPGTLAANTTYYWQIIATDGYGWSSASAVWRFTTVSGGVNPSEEVYIQAGEFQMGCDPAHNNGYSCNSAELPLHTVYLDAYYIDQYEVTNAQYEACVAAGSCTAPSSSSSYTRSSYYGNPTYANYPVIYVNWSQATAYCTWAGRRLPSEAEWEKAARGTTVRAYPWGDASPTCDIVNFYDDLGTGDFCVGDTSAVGSYPAGASQFGALDMAGNVWEWVNDWYDFTYYSTYPAEEWPPNPQGPASGTTRVQRGGSFVNYDHLLRNAYRYSYTPAYQSSRVGFRCARTP
jgi:formylglycine-generating enzyme required for sulfatase activity